MFGIDEEPSIDTVRVELGDNADASVERPPRLVDTQRANPNTNGTSFFTERQHGGDCRSLTRTRQGHGPEPKSPGHEQKRWNVVRVIKNRSDALRLRAFDVQALGRADDVDHAHLFVLRQRNAIPNLRQTSVENHLSTQRCSFDKRRTDASTALVSAAHFPQDLATVQERDVGVVFADNERRLEMVSDASAVASVVTYAFGSFTPSCRPGAATMRHSAHSMTNMTSGSESQN